MEFNNNTEYLDQHFLINEDIINKFIDICNLSKEDIVLEIGPGKGVLTKIISTKVKKLYVIEKDIRLKKYLDKIDNIEVIYDSCLDIDFPKVDKIITSLPYSIIEPFIYKLINIEFKELYMIMGKSYVDNVLNKEINNLSLLTNTFFDIEKYIDIKPNDFYPAPKVYSSIVKLNHKKELTKIDRIFQNMYKLDDKLVKNALLESLIIVNNWTKREAKEYIVNLKISNNILNTRFKLIDNNSLKELYCKIRISST